MSSVFGGGKVGLELVVGDLSPVVVVGDDQSASLSVSSTGSVGFSCG